MCVGDACSQSQPRTGFLPGGAIDLARRADVCMTGRGGWKFENKSGIVLAQRGFTGAGGECRAITPAPLWSGRHLGALSGSQLPVYDVSHRRDYIVWSGQQSMEDRGIEKLMQLTRRCL